MKHKSGQLKWIDLQGVLIDAASGETLWMMTDITKVREHQKEIEYSALHDSLTGLANRNLLNELIPQALASAARRNIFVAICYLDLNKFKPINDQYGHAVGDEVLKEIGKRLQECVRAADLVARIGGDEFVMVLTELDGPESYRDVCERARTAINTPIALGDQMLHVGVSMGIAVFPTDARDSEQLTALADERMFNEKRLNSSR
jgi:diguanylate cyclase (GGDEF)-like protein